MFNLGRTNLLADIKLLEVAIFLLVSCMEELLQEEPPGNLTILMSKHLYQQQPKQLVYNYVLLIYGQKILWAHSFVQQKEGV